MNYSKLTPLKGHVLLKFDDAKTKRGSILIPDDAQQRPQEATVISLGTAPEGSEPWQLEEGDRVLLNRYGGKDIGDGHLIILESAIVGKLHQTPEGEQVAPINDNVIVAMLPPAEKEFSTILADISKTTSEFGVVYSVAPRCRHVSEGQKIFVGKTQGFHFREGTTDFIVIEEAKVHLEVAG